VATPKGSCTDRFFQDVLQREGVKPKEYLNQPIGVITTNVRAKKIDGFATWEPQGAQVGTLVGEGSARVVATGHPWGERDSGQVIARKDFMDQHPEMVKAWLKCEIEAQMWYYDPRNHAEVLRLVQKHMKGINHKAMWFAMCGLIPEPYYGGPIRDEKPFVFNDDVHKLLNIVVKYLAKEKIVPAGEYLPGAIDDSLAREAMKEMGVSSPLVRLKAVPVEKAYPLLTAGKTEEYAELFKL
jgi:NitT/TauT family transport system substrate-binding protein